MDKLFLEFSASFSQAVMKQERLHRGSKTVAGGGVRALGCSCVGWGDGWALWMQACCAGALDLTCTAGSASVPCLVSQPQALQQQPRLDRRQNPSLGKTAFIAIHALLFAVHPLCVGAVGEEKWLSVWKRVLWFHTLFRLIIHISNASSSTSVIECVEWAEISNLKY